MGLHEDAARDSGTYPPRGYGMMNKKAKRKLIIQELKREQPDEWARQEAIKLINHPHDNKGE